MLPDRGIYYSGRRGLKAVIFGQSEPSGNYVSSTQRRNKVPNFPLLDGSIVVITAYRLMPHTLGRRNTMIGVYATSDSADHDSAAFEESMKTLVFPSTNVGQQTRGGIVTSHQLVRSALPGPADAGNAAILVSGPFLSEQSQDEIICCVTIGPDPTLSH